jgi:hypothetical protein
MIQRHKLVPFLFYLLFSFVFSVIAQGPDKSITYFQDLPARLFFFEDTEIAVYHDSVERTAYISNNEGKTWERAKDLPKGEIVMVIAHPFDNHYVRLCTYLISRQLTPLFRHLR